jgi:hypothetical protein
MSVRFLQWRKQEHPYLPSLVLFDDGERYEPTIVIYRVGDGYELQTPRKPVIYERLHEAMKAGEAYVNDRETFDNYFPTPEDDKNLLAEMDFGPELHLTGEPIPEPDDGLVHVDVHVDAPSFNDEVQRIINLATNNDVSCFPFERHCDECEEARALWIARASHDSEDEPEDEDEDEEPGVCITIITIRRPEPTDEELDTYDENVEQPVDVHVDLQPAPEAVTVSGEGYARIPLDIELETMPDAEEDLDQELALECDKTLHVQDKKANILIGFAIGLGSAAIASLLAVLLHFVSWA